MLINHRQGPACQSLGPTKGQVCHPTSVIPVFRMTATLAKTKLEVEEKTLTQKWRGTASHLKSTSGLHIYKNRSVYPQAHVYTDKNKATLRQLLGVQNYHRSSSTHVSYFFINAYLYTLNWMRSQMIRNLSFNHMFFPV